MDLQTQRSSLKPPAGSHTRTTAIPRVGRANAPLVFSVREESAGFLSAISGLPSTDSKSDGGAANGDGGDGDGDDEEGGA